MDWIDYKKREDRMGKDEGKWLLIFTVLMISAAFFLKEVMELLLQYIDVLN